MVRGQDSLVRGICQNQLFTSTLLKTVAPDNCARVSSTDGMGCTSRRTLSFNGFRSTQILTDPELLGTTTIPAHHEVGSWTLEITPSFSMRQEFLFHLLSDRYWDVAGSEERIWFSPFLQLDLVFVSKSSQSCEHGWICLSYGMCASISGVIHSHNEMSAMIEGNPRRLLLR